MMQISVYTADGMLTRATIAIPPGNRARKITVNSLNNVSGKTVTVSITPNTILSFSTPSLPIEQGLGNGLLYNQKIHGRIADFAGMVGRGCLQIRKIGHKLLFIF